MKSRILLFIFVMCICHAFAQSVSPFVVSSSGGFYSNSSAQLSFTTAEMTMVTTLTAGSSILTQGFQQPFDFSTQVTPYEDHSSSLGVYPNPGNGNFNITIDSKTASRADATVYDIIGNAVFKKELNLNTGKQTIPLNLSAFSPGIYVLELRTDDAAASDHSFQKIQIVK